MAIDVGIEEFAKKISGILTANTEPFDQEAANIMENAIAMQFESNGSYFNTPWAPLKPSTIRDRARKGYNGTNILRRLGSAGLLGSISVYVEEGFMVMQVGKNYGRYHQEGTRHMPARQFLPKNKQALPESVIRELGKAYARFVKDYFD